MQVELCRRLHCLLAAPRCPVPVAFFRPQRRVFLPHAGIPTLEITEPAAGHLIGHKSLVLAEPVAWYPRLGKIAGRSGGGAVIDAMVERLLQSPSRVRILMSGIHIYEWTNA
ncbi:hypothetical protein [Micromonospora sp. WMMD714]|uniref:hypothetical protein n=1 Tax=Micromonospora sp. WMMD714 TaxID=3016097 RepID=UPI00249CDDB9|nr:hypothetical protein [Micromonospora sp. WMMD714]WFE65680.1 hypothetical protein O7625_21405 [Micromonospora sp. WMMD714]